MKNRNRRTIRGQALDVAKTLRDVWDPIGRGQIPDLPADEYDSYAPRIISLFAAGAADREVAAYLADIEGNGMRLKPRSPEALEKIAAQLRVAAQRRAPRAT